MQPVMSRLATLMAITGLTLALLVACGGDTTTPTATQAPMPTAAPTSPSATVAPDATQAPAPTPTPAPTATQGSSPESASLWPGGIEIDADTAWQEVLDVLTAPEQDCIRGALGNELESVMTQPVASIESADWEGQVFSCLEAETARALYISGTVASVFDFFGFGSWELNEEEASCIRESMSDVDVAALVAVPEGSSGSDELSARLSACVPSLMVASLGINPGELSEEETSCLRELDVPAWVAAAEESPESDVFLYRH